MQRRDLLTRPFKLKGSSQHYRAQVAAPVRYLDKQLAGTMNQISYASDYAVNMHYALFALGSAGACVHSKIG